jgi:hypothetical protein
MKANYRVMSPYLSSNFRGDDDLRNMNRYINEMCMDQSGTWSTEVECMAISTLLQMNVHISSLGATKTPKREWLTFKPLFRNDSCLNSSIKPDVCLFHTNNRNHYDAVIIDKNPIT